MDRTLSFQGRTSTCAWRRMDAGSSGWRRARAAAARWVCGWTSPDLKNKELEIERGRADYQSLVNSLSDMVYALNSKGVFTFASAAAIELLELPAAAVVGKRFADFLEDEDLERATAAARAHLRSTDDGVRQINLRVKRADGSVRHMECRYRRPPGGPGQTVAAVGVMRDVTERVELAARLERQMAEVEHGRAEYQALLDSLGDVVLKVDPHSNRIVFANAAAAERWGLQMVGADAFDHIASDDRERVSASIQGSLAGGRPRLVQLRYRVVTASGEQKHVEANCRKVWGLDGKSLIVAIVRDIEDRVRLERRLAEEMGNLRSIVESIGAGVMLTDRDLRVIVVNREVLNIHGLTEKDVVGRPVTETVGTALEMDVYRQWLAGEHTNPARYTRSLVDASGRHRLFSLTASPILNSSGAVRQIAFLGVDDTERRETEQALFAAERLTTVGEMAATVAHELSQPLQVIDLACHSAKDELANSAERGSAVDRAFMATKMERIGHQVERATRIVGDLRAFVRGAGAGDDAVPFQIAEAVHGAVDLTTHGLRQQQAILSASLPDDLPPVVGHVGRLAAGAGQPDQQRARCRRPLHFGRRQCRRARRPAIGAHRGRGFGPGHRARRAVAPVRGLRHHQGARQGHRPRPAHLPPHRRGDGRLDLGQQSGRGWRLLRDPAAGSGVHRTQRRSLALNSGPARAVIAICG